ncbi:MAG: DUF1080 domain-containing protein, partial [Draconibacterium sp.]|nr:DUF1080 domain-containing protein [Draconibacterium sp.]
MKTTSFYFLIISVLFLTSCQPQIKSGDWQTIFDGETLDGWKKAGENPESIYVEDGAIKCAGSRSHLFYEGEFKNFEFEAEIKTLEHSNSGIFIHTKYQKEGWPAVGYEIQVNNSYRGSVKNPERKKTGSIYSIRNVYYPLANDNEWFTMRIKVVENFIEIFVNDVKVNEYTEPDNAWRWEGGETLKLGSGSFALQAHDPKSTVYYKNIKLKELPAGEKKSVEDKDWDTLITKLMKPGFPIIDFHVHLKGGLTIDEVVANSQKLGINYGVAPNCGL